MLGIRHVRRRFLLTAALGAAVLVVPAAQPWADAADPSEGSISDSATTVSWAGGPFVVPNVSGNVTDPVCPASAVCDDFTLHVSTPPGYESGHQLSISVAWPNSAADFDLYVLDSAGAVVGTSASSADPELVLLPPNSGDYTVRVVPFAPLGQSYTATATLTSTPVPPPPATIAAPAYRNYAAPASMPDQHNAGEPSIGVNFDTGSVMYQSYLSTYRVLFDAGNNATWTNRTANATNGCVVGDTTSLDPILFTDRRTGRTFESQLAGATSLTCYTDDDGLTWFPTEGAGIPAGVDHQTIGGGPSSEDPFAALSTYPGAVYYCSQDIADASCAVSRDGGTVFGPPVPIYNLTQCGGLHGHVKVDPSSGAAYVPNKGCGADQAVVVSEDTGSTWAVRQVPGATPGSSDPSVGIGSNGTLYFGFQGSDNHAGVAVSHDHGKTWQHLQDVGAQLGVKNIVFPAVVAGDDDRAAFAFLGSKTGGNYEDAANFHGVWHLYIATTIDGGVSWKTVDATPTNPVQRGSICTGGTTCGEDRNLLDFMDVTVDPQGRVLVGYADGCTGTCATSGGTQNFDALATIARQTAGPRLFAAADPKPDLTMGNLTAGRSGSTVTLKATVTNRGSARATNVQVAFYRGTTWLGTSGAISVAAGKSATVTVKTTALPRGRQTVTTVADPKDRVAESNETNNRFSRKVTT